MFAVLGHERGLKVLDRAFFAKLLAAQGFQDPPGFGQVGVQHDPLATPVGVL